MAFFERVFKSRSSDVDIEDFLNSLDVQEESHEDADALVKPLSLNDLQDCEAVVKEAKAGNIVLVSIEGLAKRNALKLRELVTDIRDKVHAMDGDIARISDDKIIVTPSKVKIVKRRGNAE